MQILSSICKNVESINDFSIICNVRKRLEVDEDIENDLKKYGLYDISNIYYFQSYGKLSDSKYDKPVIVQNID